jgi:hypothetical protein
MSGDEMSRQDVIDFIVERLDIALRNIDQVVDNLMDDGDQHLLFVAMDKLIELKNCCNDDEE